MRLGNVLGRLHKLDGLVINLECVLSTRAERQRTHRPFHFRADPEWGNSGPRTRGRRYLCAGEQPRPDYEEVALWDTMEALDETGIAHAGAGETIDASARARDSNGRGSSAGDDEPNAGGDSGLDVAVVSFTDNTPEYAADEESRRGRPESKSISTIRIRVSVSDALERT